METKQEAFYKTVIRIALPVTLQSLLQSSFSVVDQVMIGQLGSKSIAGIGLGGKFASMYSVVLGAVAAAAGILISQYIGKKEEREVSRSFFRNLGLAVVLALIFMAACLFFADPIMEIYTKEKETVQLAGEYLSLLAFSFLPMAVSTIVTTLLRCLDAAVFPLYASIAAVILNTGLNYLLIFGKLGMPQLGVPGAALATVISQYISCVLILLFGVWYVRKQKGHEMLRFSVMKKRISLRDITGENRRQYLEILGPILVCEFVWSLGENVYAGIYGNIGTDACAAMTLTAPIQGLMIGALSGLSQAAGILIGKSLGSGERKKAYQDSRKLMLYGLSGALVLSLLLVIFRRAYVQIYQVEPQVRAAACEILLVFAVFSPVKVENMILGGGIIRSGGRTKYVMWIDLIGTWLFGVPFGMLAAFVWKWQVPYVYLMLSLEECVRLGISLVLFRKKTWMIRIK
ncbi:MAG: MATE family efflux transporter [Candidatus Limivivens sp.]|nr:MATE family efflux transporter [Candidatus Limivivens sp.]